MKLSKGACKQCGRHGAYGSVHYALCPVCNHKRLKQLKTPPKTTPKKRPILKRFNGVLPTGQHNTHATGGNAFKRKKKPLKTSQKQTRRTPTGEAVVFREIWAVRERRCINCKTWLGNVMRSFFFAHIKPKSTHPHLRLDPNNIMLLCWECHDAYDKRGIEAYNKRKKE